MYEDKTRYKYSEKVCRNNQGKYSVSTYLLIYSTYLYKKVNINLLNKNLLDFNLCVKSYLGVI